MRTIRLSGDAAALYENDDGGWTIHVPGLRLQSEANLREHWTKKASRVREQRQVIHWAFRALLSEKQIANAKKHTSFEVVRIAPRALDRFDNLPRSMKAIVDELSEITGVDDGDPRFELKALQRKGAPKEYGVEIRWLP